MAVPPQDDMSPNVVSSAHYINRELSWLEYNRRVLWQGLDPRTPLLEALRFLAIFSKNLDEYFMVRVAALKQQIAAQVHPPGADGLSPAEQMRLIGQRLRPMVNQQHQAFFGHLRPQMGRHGVRLLTYGELSAEQRAFMVTYFEDQIFPVLTPLIVDTGHPFPYLSNLSLNLVVLLSDRQSSLPQVARVKIPRVLPRFLPLPEVFRRHPYPSCHWLGIPLEEVITHHLQDLFPGLEVQGHYLFRLTRNADLVVAEEEAGDLMQAIEQELRKRPLGGSAVRLELQRHTPRSVRTLLMEFLNLGEADIYDIDGWLGLGDLTSLASLPVPELKDPPWVPALPPALRALQPGGGVQAEGLPPQGEGFFALVRQQDQLFHHPYHCFVATVQQFIIQAAHDPQVLAIKMTLYRIAGGSPILRALAAAAERGKQVTVVVELKARFDEENNINWARHLEQAGVHVVYGLMGLKTRAKMVMVVRREADAMIRYCHLGTGDYNPKTALHYTDLSLLSARPDLGADMAELFNYLTGYSRQHSYRQLLVAPLTLRQSLERLIQGEIDHAQRGEGGEIIAKLNTLVDPDLIARLYQASQVGVSIDLIVRGICCLRPGMAGISENIRVISIIGRFLEHSRILYFRQGGNETFLLGSADWTPSNLDSRVEVLVPVRDRPSQAELRLVLDLALSDQRQAWDLAADGNYSQRQPQSLTNPCNFQQRLMDRASQPNRR